MKQTLLLICAFAAISGILYVSVPRDLIQPSMRPSTPVPAPHEATPATASSAPSLPKLDAGAWLACRKFEPLARDVNAGLLTSDEFRDGLKDVREEASAWPNSAVSLASTALLRTLTIGGKEQEMKAQFFALVDACRDWEHRR
jgi:hypothetical protein